MQGQTVEIGRGGRGGGDHGYSGRTALVIRTIRIIN